MGTVFKFYVGQDEIYSGELREVPERYGAAMKEDIANWADSLGKGGLNELVYSHLAWYAGKEVFCTSCDYRGDGNEVSCPECRAELRYEYHHERNPKLDLIMDCIGMITRIVVID